MGSIIQSILPSILPFPRSIDIRPTSNRHVGDAVSHLLNRRTPTPPSYIIPIGIAYHTSLAGEIDFMALANTTMAFLVVFDDKSQVRDKNFTALLSAGGEELGQALPRACLVGFSMARTAVCVSKATQLRVKGVDLCSLHSPDTWSPKSPAETVLHHLSSKADRWKITSLWLGDEESAKEDVCTQAWLAACVGSNCQAKIATSVKVSTQFINVSERDYLAQMVIQSDLLASHAPRETPNDFSKAVMNKSGKIELQNSRFKTRVRRSNHTQVIMTDFDGREYVGDAQGSKGKTTTIKIQGNQQGFGGLQSVRVVGRQEPTNSERARDELIHLVLTGQKDLRRSPFIRALWFPKWKETDLDHPIHIVDFETAETFMSNMRLNESQRRVVRGMVCDTRVVVAHGPPGTGKTTTIGAASRIWASLRWPVWIVAHSNVAVKNIAETLAKNGVDFKLVVSKEFYDEWHEHLYIEVEKSLIRSDELPKDSHGMERLLGDSCIVLCTLSMLSNPMLYDNGTFNIVRLERLIIDEASQINIFEFMHLFEKFQATLGKVCFFGDPMQLPPYGNDKVPSIQTVFDLLHISNSGRDFFLDTQYRMPVAIGQFISSAVYSGRLQSDHSIKHDDCVAFVDVASPRGNEEKVGFSWRNNGEIQAIVHLVKYYYRHKKICILTPYDSQRAAIQRALEGENLPWESVFNVDSFQGNEADYVLISVVRSGRNPGFLSSLNRMNVLLTRCRKAMVFVTSSSFVDFGGSNTLIGKIAVHWYNKRKQRSGLWIDWRLIADGVADLPDAPGPNKLKNNTGRREPLRNIENRTDWSDVASEQIAPTNLNNSHVTYASEEVYSSPSVSSIPTSQQPFRSWASVAASNHSRYPSAWSIPTSQQPYLSSGQPWDAHALRQPLWSSVAGFNQSRFPQGPLPAPVAPMFTLNSSSRFNFVDNSVYAQFPDTEDSILHDIMEHSFKPEDLPKLSRSPVKIDSEREGSGETDPFPSLHSLIMPLMTYFSILQSLVASSANISALQTIAVGSSRYTHQLLALDLQYEWPAIAKYHIHFHNARRAEMWAGDYSGWLLVDPDLLSRFVEGHRRAQLKSHVL